MGAGSRQSVQLRSWLNLRANLLRPPRPSDSNRCAITWRSSSSSSSSSCQKLLNTATALARTSSIFSRYIPFLSHPVYCLRPGCSRSLPAVTHLRAHQVRGSSPCSLRYATIKDNSIMQTAQPLPFSSTGAYPRYHRRSRRQVVSE